MVRGGRGGGLWEGGGRGRASDVLLYCGRGCEDRGAAAAARCGPGQRVHLGPDYGANGLDCVVCYFKLVTLNHHQQLSYMHDLELGALIENQCKKIKIKQD